MPQSKICNAAANSDEISTYFCFDASHIHNVNSRSSECFGNNLMCNYFSIKLFYITVDCIIQERCEILEENASMYNV